MSTNELIERLENVVVTDGRTTTINLITINECHAAAAALRRLVEERQAIIDFRETVTQSKPLHLAPTAAGEQQWWRRFIENRGLILDDTGGLEMAVIQTPIGKVLNSKGDLVDDPAA